MRKVVIQIVPATALLLGACSQPINGPLRVPSMEYASQVRGEEPPQTVLRGAAMIGGVRAHASDALYRAKGEPVLAMPAVRNVNDSQAMDTFDQPLGDMKGITAVPSQRPLSRDYLSPLSLGDPGVSASLWREGRDLSLVRDNRAFQPYDLITVSVVENSEGSKQADTEIKQDSTFSATIEKLLGIENYFKNVNKTLDPNNPLIQAELASHFKSEGETTRKGNLKAKISAMVMEVLPSGVMRVEGEKIISVNNEDEVMVISGLVRPEDVNSNNEVDSSKVANVRVDYFGKGSVGSAQTGGWLGNLIRSLWPI